MPHSHCRDAFAATLSRAPPVATHNTLAIGYTLFLAVGLIGLPWKSSVWMHHTGLLPADELPRWEILAWVWNLLRFIEEGEQLLRTKDKSDYWSDVYNLIDQATYLSITVAAVLRAVLAADCGWPGESLCQGSAMVGALGFDFQGRRTGLWCVQFAYACSLLLACVRMINMLKVNKGVGVLIIMLGEMTSQIAMWFLVALLIMSGFSLFFTVVMPAEILYEHPISWPAWAPFWGLLGELELEAVTTYNPPYEPNPSATLVPFFLWAYSFIATGAAPSLPRVPHAPSPRAH